MRRSIDGGPLRSPRPPAYDEALAAEQEQPGIKSLTAARAEMASILEALAGDGQQALGSADGEGPSPDWELVAEYRGLEAEGRKLEVEWLEAELELVNQRLQLESDRHRAEMAEAKAEQSSPSQDDHRNRAVLEEVEADASIVAHSPQDAGPDRPDQVVRWRRQRSWWP